MKFTNYSNFRKFKKSINGLNTVKKKKFKESEALQTKSIIIYVYMNLCTYQLTFDNLIKFPAFPASFRYKFLKINYEYLT